jgi:hypothetical protein
MAITTTIRRFRPSGSLKSEKNILEQARAVMAKMSSEIFFGLKCIGTSISLGILYLLAVWDEVGLF